ncbi:T9SS type A sorting domain-containing protein [Flammeovirga yaeyamensis]|uniref:T9SS type A sorting domain-containing protein n=1 Tax=Flammeovirga yaeyamensis TaxID=367791 RepID=A0AAX1NBV5_9BACT|nr:T9SS type A sorting domain-containing protein [Flammeovirga yaeyamensis]MBB3697095.1 hypothetical protein [Flammeovirga yaeyamensis]NMF33757.1 T9SS type A sorting domain-containing protein [Flammeovirga yaeyamensis]QWG04977.1 T9SS type A sorting domain-containing protein [Flammeovirga yaeyamensis]
MKNILMWSLLLCLSSAIAQNPKSTFDTEIYSSSNYMVGIPYKVLGDGFINTIQMECNATGDKVKFYIYADEDNAPGELIVSSNEIKMSLSQLSITFEDTFLEQGTYWVFTQFEKDGKFLKANVSNNLSKVFYKGLAFGDTPPQTAYDFEEYTGHQFPISLIYKPQKLHDEIRLFPNPTIDNVHIISSNDKYFVEVFDQQGRLLIEDWSEQKEFDIAFRQYQKGTYFIKIDHKQSYRIIKE